MLHSPTLLLLGLALLWRWITTRRANVMTDLPR
jgi:hypothetical protein